jgi:hypothetical protein
MWYPLYRRLGPKGQSGLVQKMSPPPGFNLQTVHPIVSCYINYVIPPLHYILIYLYLLHDAIQISYTPVTMIIMPRHFKWLSCCYIHFHVTKKADATVLKSLSLKIIHWMILVLSPLKTFSVTMSVFFWQVKHFELLANLSFCKKYHCSFSSLHTNNCCLLWIVYHCSKSLKH